MINIKTHAFNCWQLIHLSKAMLNYTVHYDIIIEYIKEEF